MTKEYYEAEVVNDKGVPKVGTRLARPQDDRWIAGVCSGLGQRFGFSVGAIRLIFILLFILPPAAILPYIILWILIPGEK